MISPIQALQEQRRLLQIEYDEEKMAFSEITARIGLKRLAERGNAWMPIRISRSFYNSLNQRVVEITRSESDSDDDHNFEYGLLSLSSFWMKMEVRNLHFLLPEL